MAQTYIVTGAASGIGLALCQRLLDQGQQVCACDIDYEALKSHYTEHELVDDGGTLMLYPLDVRRVEQWQQLISKVLTQWSTIDVMCNVAGVLKDNWVTDIVIPDEVDFHFDINVKGTIYGTQSVIEPMRNQAKDISLMWLLWPPCHRFQVCLYIVPASMRYALIHWQPV
ncbi:Cyclopentanol dehydrogenase [Psychrobacter piechaudii]|uniref:Cyclopentanol dehydrogenase n=1 Tax=Psychrobacter piechaudii TaxID=1945521 RepID=A0A1R4GWA7_9GAMM|nr:Cyclopentanol dehydrogenase [Psychrobacter piechaudii]